VKCGGGFWLRERCVDGWIVVCMLGDVRSMFVLKDGAQRREKVDGKKVVGHEFTVALCVLHNSYSRPIERRPSFNAGVRLNILLFISATRY